MADQEGSAQDSAPGTGGVRTGSRVCEWCGEPLRPLQQATDTAAHRAKRWRWLRGELTAAGEPPEAPPWPESPLHGRMGEQGRSNTAQVGSEPEPGPRSGKHARSGLLISYRRVHRLLVAHFKLTPEHATALLKPQLSDGQRRRLEELGG